MSHQCDCCCWLNPVHNYCECPYAMRTSACEEARKLVEKNEYPSKAEIQAVLSR